MDILEKVKEFADKAHGEQKRKYAGERYIVHPVRVMNICRAYTQSRVILAAALLHDVLEDTPVGKDQIFHFLEDKMTPDEAAEVVKLVVALTDVYIKESYPHLNRNRRKYKEAERLGNIHADAQTIKYADIIDNTMDITQYDPDFAPVYLKECRNLLSNMTKGNPQLYKKAIDSVDELMKKYGKK